MVVSPPTGDLDALREVLAEFRDGVIEPLGGASPR
jgi:hypothetical protein